MRSDSSYKGPLVCQVQAVTWGKHPMTGCKCSSCEQTDCHKPLFQRQWGFLVHRIYGETASVYTANHQREVIRSLEKKSNSVRFLELIRSSTLQLVRHALWWNYIRVFCHWVGGASFNSSLVFIHPSRTNIQYLWGCQAQNSVPV